MGVDEDQNSLEQLSEYIRILSNVTRLRILKYIEKKPRDVRAISRELKISYENTKIHLEKLTRIGVLKKDPGKGALTSKGVHPVWLYSIIPEGLNWILTQLGNNILVAIYGEPGSDDNRSE